MNDAVVDERWRVYRQYLKVDPCCFASCGRDGANCMPCYEGGFHYAVRIANDNFVLSQCDLRSSSGSRDSLSMALRMAMHNCNQERVKEELKQLIDGLNPNQYLPPAIIKED